MSIQKVKNLLRATAGKVLIGHCFCGVEYEIRSLKRNIIDISTSSGKRSEQFTEEGEAG
jgi:hypothetical protein